MVERPDDDYDEPDGEWEDCWDCEGLGDIHDCGEDCCCCADPDGPDDEERIPCSTCEGRGGWLVPWTAGLSDPLSEAP